MTAEAARRLLRFPRHRFTVEAPATTLADLEMLYPGGVVSPRTSDPEVDGAFSLRGRPGAWVLDRTDEPEELGSFERPVHAWLKLEHTVEGLILDCPRADVAFHGGAVALPEGASLVAGTADAGKSSTIFQLVELGHPFLAEELALVDGEGRVTPHPQSIALSPRVLADFERERAPACGRVETIDEFLLRYLPHRPCRRPTPLRSILLPEYSPREEPAVERLPASDVLTDVLRFCFEPRGDAEATIDRVIELVSAIPVVRFRYRDAGSARATLQSLFGTGAP